MQRKIVFPLHPNSDGYPPVGFESIWADHQGDNRYKIDNIPFFTQEATLGDIVEAVERDGKWCYVNTLEESGNSLIRVVYYQDFEARTIRQALEQMGCSTEWSSDLHLIAVNIPPEVNMIEVQTFLHQGFEQDRWDYEEAIRRLQSIGIDIPSKGRAMTETDFS